MVFICFFFFFQTFLRTSCFFSGDTCTHAVLQRKKKENNTIKVSHFAFLALSRGMEIYCYVIGVAFVASCVFFCYVLVFVLFSFFLFFANGRSSISHTAKRVKIGDDLDIVFISPHCFALVRWFGDNLFFFFCLI